MNADQLNKYGLNIFASCPLASLPEELKTFIPNELFLRTENTLSLCITGHGGKNLWKNLPHPLTGLNPIDDFSKELVKKYFPEALILFPDSLTENILPLQKFGRALNISRQSQLGIDIHPEFGLWFAYRCVFITSLKIPQIMLESISSPCESCGDKRCLAEKDFQKARLACPYKKEHQYSIEQLKYHSSKLPS